jgi:hypothetical protein
MRRFALLAVVVVVNVWEPMFKMFRNPPGPEWHFFFPLQSSSTAPPETSDLPIAVNQQVPNCLYWRDGSKPPNSMLVSLRRCGIAALLQSEKQNKLSLA